MNAAELVFNEHVLRGISESDRELLVKLLSQITRTLSTLELEASAEIHKWPLKEALSLVDQATD